MTSHPCCAGIVAIMMGMKPGEEKVAPLRFPTDGAMHVLMPA